MGFQNTGFEVGGPITIWREIVESSPTIIKDDLMIPECKRGDVDLNNFCV